MTHGPVAGLLAFWSGIQASIWIGNFPGDTFSEHRTWYSLECAEKEDLLRMKTIRRSFTMMMRFLTLFFLSLAYKDCLAIELGLPQNYSLCRDDVWGKTHRLVINTKMCSISLIWDYGSVRSALLQIELNTQRNPHQPHTTAKLWMLAEKRNKKNFLLLERRENIFISQILYFTRKKTRSSLEWISHSNPSQCKRERVLLNEWKFITQVAIHIHFRREEKNIIWKFCRQPIDILRAPFESTKVVMIRDDVRLWGRRQHAMRAITNYCQGLNGAASRQPIILLHTSMKR